MLKSFVVWAILFLTFSKDIVCQENPIWTYECLKGYCQKSRVQPGSEDAAVSLPVCQLTCSDIGSLWPKPTGSVFINKSLTHISINDIDIVSGQENNPADKLIIAAGKHFMKNVKSLATPSSITSGGKHLTIIVKIEDPTHTQLTLETDESYSLKICQEEEQNGDVKVTINAETFFGGRHGLETLSQLMVHDDIKDKMVIPTSADITDVPIYPYRGVLLDTARNYISVAAIKRTIQGLAASKMNTFHWHITDSQSFPYVSKSRPDLSRLGAYSPKKVYTPSDVAEIVQFAREHGVRVLPEFDAPAHVGEGWQDTDFVACFKEKPWSSYCWEPPCGQFDPTKDKLYDALEDIYKDMIEQFDPDLFHMGGDEVAMSCWNSTPNIVEWMKTNHNWGRGEEDFIKLWNYFQSQALERFDAHTNQKIPIVMWTSALTGRKYVEKYLPKDRYIIQVWTTRYDRVIRDLLRRDYRIILSNYDALYLDCGFGSWLSHGNNWCSPYKGWQKLYNNSPTLIAGLRRKQVLGGEAALWTEQADDAAVDSRIWPRAAALGERLWADPLLLWRHAESRMLIHRERLVKRGIQADALVPKWCLNHQGSCPTLGKHNRPDAYDDLEDFDNIENL